jgi:hypothetical protein
VRVFLAVCVLLLAPSACWAGANQESMFQDDNELLYSPPEQVRANLDQLRGLGVDRLRVTVLWKSVAPDAGSYTRPAGFDATDPESYPAELWERYDFLATEAAARGLRLNFNLTAPAPLWATAKAPREEIIETFEPSAEEFGAFVTAVGRRYSGDFVRRDGVRLPRVAYWSIWNEPNHSGWLTPQWSADLPSAFPRAASLYRQLLGAAWNALNATGHTIVTDKILIGETAPKGDKSKGVKRYVEAMTFVRALYCVDSRGRPLSGPRAGELACPADPAAFPAANPALFLASGFAHHPYELILSPRVAPLRPNWVTIANLGRLTGTLDKIFRRYGSRRRMPLYLTEYGYQTNPPDPVGVSFKRQAEYLNLSEYIAWRNPRVKTLSQFLLVDDDLAVPASFQSGLLLREGRVEKRALTAYRLPIWIPRPHVRRGRSVRVWGLIRPGENGKPVSVTIEHRPAGSRDWAPVRTVTINSRRNYLYTTARVRRTGHLRLTYGGNHSRSAFVRIR